MFSLLHKTIEQFIHLDPQEKALFENAFSFREVPKKFTLVKYGQITRELYFINKGLLRLYYDKNGEEITGYIFREGLFASSYDSFLRQSPSIQYLETLENCELLVIRLEQLEELYRTVPKINILTRKIAEQRFINSQMILSSFLLDTPEERYQKFVEQHSDLLLRVPHHIIASYLGITPVSMSRIRKRQLQGAKLPERHKA
ncbi:MAG TPA: Crp/Fnr family transcriptional regulator [Saprospiraceae bacterium]|nr:Crp/Fnr family transcriptional regulator [Saprospiraceae bacterium]